MSRGKRHMRRMVAAVVAIIALIGAVSVSSSADAQLDEFMLSVDSAEGPVGQLTTVHVELSFDPLVVAFAPAAVEATFLWDTAEIEVVDCVSLVALGWCSVQDGRAQLAVVDSSQLGDGQLQIARMSVVPKSLGVGTIQVTDVVGYDMSGVAQQPESVDGQVTGLVAGPAAVTGDVDCSGGMDIVDALVIAQWSVSTRADSQGCPLFAPASQLDVSEGDLDGDGDTTIVDALLVARCVAGVRVFITCPVVDE